MPKKREKPKKNRKWTENDLECAVRETERQTKRRHKRSEKRQKKRKKTKGCNRRITNVIVIIINKC